MMSKDCKNCVWGSPEQTVQCYVFTAAENSCTGKDRWAYKPIDKCIVSIVSALNDAGIYTTASCCGHGKRDGSILLLDGRELTIREREEYKPAPPNRCKKRNKSDKE
jgi:hypothetical protein